ncbi:hypothetical protein ACVGXS_04935, partial [Enterobacter hormaechei]
VDTVAPGAPPIVTITDHVAPGTRKLGSGISTNDTPPQLTGKAEAGSTVTILSIKHISDPTRHVP